MLTFLITSVYCRELQNIRNIHRIFRYFMQGFECNIFLLLLWICQVNAVDYGCNLQVCNSWCIKGFEGESIKGLSFCNERPSTSGICISMIVENYALPSACTIIQIIWQAASDSCRCMFQGPVVSFISGHVSVICCLSSIVWTLKTN